MCDCVCLGVTFSFFLSAFSHLVGSIRGICLEADLTLLVVPGDLSHFNPVHFYDRPLAHVADAGSDVLLSFFGVCVCVRGMGGVGLRG